MGWQTWRVHELPGFRQRTDPGSILFGGCMPSLNLDINYFTHPKTMRLVARLGAGAAEIPPRLWAYAAKYHVEDGELQGYEPAELLHLAGITAEDPVGLMATLVLLKWLDKTENGWTVHDWQEHAGHLVAFSERAKKANAVRWDKYRSLKDSKDDTQGLPARGSRNPPTYPPALPNQPYPPRVQALLGRYPTTRPRPENEGGAVEVLWTEQDEAALVVAVESDPAYPWEAAVETERKAGKGIRGLASFVAKRPAPTPRLKSLQARLEAPAPAPVSAPETGEDWEGSSRFMALTTKKLTAPLSDSETTELSELTAEYHRRTA